MHIGILGQGFVGWGGGIEFIRLCVQGLITQKPDHDLKITLLLPDPEPSKLLTKSKHLISYCKRIAMEVLDGKKPDFNNESAFTKTQLLDTFRPFENEIDICFYELLFDVTSIISDRSIDVIIPSFIPLKHFSIAWVGYIADFQHIYFPQNFSQHSRNSRDVFFKKILKESVAVIVNSKAVAEDARHFYPELSSMLFCMPFSASPLPAWFDQAEIDVIVTYNLPSKYFVISNQFWVHKDHLTAFSALAKLISTTGDNDIHIVCTGNTVGNGSSSFWDTMHRYIINLSLEKNIHFLGYIPKKDQINIIKKAMAIIQPTLFEGGPGGGAVYDAVAMGVPAILTDIKVNLEISSEINLYYFKAGDSEMLSQEMEKVINLRPERPTKDKLLLLGNSRMGHFGKCLLEAAAYAYKQHKSDKFLVANK